MGLLGEIFSAGDGAKRKLKGLLSDPLGELGLLGTRLYEDTQSMNQLAALAHPLRGIDPMPSDETPQSRERYVAQNSASNQLAEMAANIGMAAPLVWHGTKNLGALSGLQGRPGGLKMMDGLGPHVGTAEAANERLLKNNGVRNWNKPSDAMDGAFVMPLDLTPKKEFVKKSGQPYTETELQSKLSDLAVKLGFDKNKTRAFSSAYPASYEMKQAQAAVRDHLRAQGYDAIPYINSHEARGSTSYVVLEPDKLKSIFDSAK